MGCCGSREFKNTTNQNTNLIYMDKKELSKEIYSYMEGALQSAGIAMKFQTHQIVQMVDYHNKFFGTNISAHSLNDVRQAVINLKALYHSIRRGEVTFQEEESEPEAKPGGKNLITTDDVINSINDINNYTAKENEIEGEKETEKDYQDQTPEETKEVYNVYKCSVCGKPLRTPNKTVCDGCKKLKNKQ